jgi:hypothetical protein
MPPTPLRGRPSLPAAAAPRRRASAARQSAETARFQSDALARIQEVTSAQRAAATRFEGRSRATAARLGGDAAREASFYGAGGTILGGAGSALRAFGGFGGGGNAFFPSAAFLRNEWGY